MKTIDEILEELKKFSLKTRLNFDKEWFKLAWITKEQEILTEYISDCRDPIYEKYGHTVSERIKNLDDFYNSEGYSKCKIRYGGQVISKQYPSRIKNLISKIKNEKIEGTLIDFCDRIEKNVGDSDKIAVLTETDIKTERENLINNILRHEWIHILLDKNRIHPNKWEYNEGLVTYIEFYLMNRLDTMEDYAKKQKNNFEKEYFLKGIIFRDLVKNIKDEDQFRKIKEFLKTN
jgi:hypothetical protein